MQVATAMNADRVVLTHFSQRYPRLPVGLPVEGDPNYGYHIVAYDGMVIPLCMATDMPNLMPLLTGETNLRLISAISKEPLAGATCVHLHSQFCKSTWSTAKGRQKRRKEGRGLRGEIARIEVQSLC